MTATDALGLLVAFLAGMGACWFLAWRWMKIGYELGKDARKLDKQSKGDVGVVSKVDPEPTAEPEPVPVDVPTLTDQLAVEVVAGTLPVRQAGQSSGPRHAMRDRPPVAPVRRVDPDTERMTAVTP